MPTIIPIRDMRDTSKISEMCHATAQQAEEGKLIDGDSAMASLRSKYVR